MKTKTAFLVLSVMLLISTSALAATHSYDFCFKYNVEFEDASVGDYYTNNLGNVTAYGIYATFYRESDGHIMWSDYADANTGCVYNLTLDTTQKYDIKLTAGAQLPGGNYMYVKHSTSNPVFHYQFVKTGLTPAPVNWVYTYVYNYNSTWKASNVLAAIGFSLVTKSAGTTNQQYFIYTQECSPSGACFSDSIPAIKLGSDARDEKFTISHELGHYIEYNYTGVFQNNCTWCGVQESDESCKSTCDDSSHKWTSKEYGSCAASEGLANFYSTAVWQSAEGNNCYCRFGDQTYDCLILNHRMESYCDDTPHNGKGVEGDWNQFWWNIHVGSEYATCGNNGAFVPLSNIFSIYADADPTPWDPGTQSGWRSQDGYAELYYSAVNGGYVSSSVWTDCAQQAGIDHPNI